MIAENQLLENIWVAVSALSPELRLRLLQRITESLLETVVEQPRPLHYGKYESDRLSTLEDFAIAEWRPGEIDL